MKLEIKHIAPYLPYGLSVNAPFIGTTDKSIRVLTPYMLGQFLAGERTIKPILRSLSDLTKEIEHNGEKFVPLVKYVESLGEPCDDFNELCLTDYQQACLSMLSTYEMRHQQDLEFLQEHHFDYQDLIKNGLAVSTHDVKQ